VRGGGRRTRGKEKGGLKKKFAAFVVGKWGTGGRSLIVKSAGGWESRDSLRGGKKEEKRSRNEAQDKK